MIRFSFWPPTFTRSRVDVCCFIVLALVFVFVFVSCARQLTMFELRRRGGLVVRELDFRSEGRWLESWCRPSNCFLRQSALSLFKHPGVWSSFSIECRNTKTKVITVTNHISRKKSNEPIRTRSKYMQPAPNAGKRVQASYDWFCFCFWLVEKLARFFSQS